MKRVCCLIPVRYNSSRLPGKPLLEINNKSIIRLTWESCLNISGIDKEDIYVATDNERIANEIRTNGGNVVFVNRECVNGTERIYYALQDLQKSYDVVINVQGDEPFINPSHIDKAVNSFLENTNTNCVCSTLHYKITSEKQVYDKGVGKLILNNKNYVLYCSRAMIPHNKDGQYDKKCTYYGHVGVFVFNVSYLDTFMKTNTNAQICEDIEWLKIIEEGYDIISTEISHCEIGINTQEDYEYLKNKYSHT